MCLLMVNSHNKTNRPVDLDSSLFMKGFIKGFSCTLVWVSYSLPFLREENRALNAYRATKPGFLLLLLLHFFHTQQCATANRHW